jgi:hypothetical protein
LPQGGKAEKSNRNLPIIGIEIYWGFDTRDLMLIPDPRQKLLIHRERFSGREEKKRI